MQIADLFSFNGADADVTQRANLSKYFLQTIYKPITYADR